MNRKVTLRFDSDPGMFSPIRHAVCCFAKAFGVDDGDV
jgi:hypothetical protein